VELKAAGHSFEVVLISSDRSRESAQAYHRKMPWPMLEFGQTPGCILEVPGYPTLVVFDPNGKPIGDFEGSTVVMSVPFDQWPNYEQIKKEKEKALATEWDALPAELSHPKHAHPLKKTAKMYGGTSSWNCDVCGGSGGSCRGYQCSRCGWDAHPACVGATPSPPRLPQPRPAPQRRPPSNLRDRPALPRTPTSSNNRQILHILGLPTKDNSPRRQAGGKNLRF
jgi:hypothetical protein